MKKRKARASLPSALNSEISRRFLRLDPGSLERLGRYETALWRQAYQVILRRPKKRRSEMAPQTILLGQKFSSITIDIPKD